jgi:fibronectin type 3 domain-containing protein
MKINRSTSNRWWFSKLKPLIMLTMLVAGLLAWSVAAPGGKALAAGTTSCTPAGTTYGTDTLSVSIPAGGGGLNYTIWSRIQVPSTPSSAPLLLNIDSATGSACYNVGSSSTAPSTWVWVNSGSQVLSQSTHTFVYTGLQSGVSLDRVEALSDSTCTPTGTGDNCTPAADTTAPTVSVTAPTNGATVSGTTTLTATASDDSGTVSKVEFYNGTTLLGTDTTSPYSFSWNTTTVANGSKTITAKAYDPSGNVGTSSVITVTVNNVAACTTGTLAPPTALTKGAVTYTSIALSWTAPSPTSGCSITGYKVFRNGTQVGTTTGATTYTDSGLTSGTSYAYSVQATDSGPNTSAQSTTANATTTADNLAPSVPGSVSVTGTTAGSVGLGWSASTDNPNPGGSGVKGYNVYRNGSSTPLNATPLTGTTYSDTTVSASTSYTYVITAIDNTSNESAPSTVANATTPAPTCSGTPSVPGGLHATAETLNSVSFAWTASTASAGCTLSGYHVYRGGTLVTDVTSATSFTNSGLSPNTSYSYTLAAFDTSGHTSAQTSAVSIATTPDTTAPTAPGSVTATATGSAQVNLAWTAGTDNVGITGYKVYRSDKGAVALATLSGSTLTYSDTTVAANTSYTYQVSALDAANNESPKTTATPNPVHTPAATDTTAPSAPTNLAAPVIASQAASLSWTAATDNVAVAGYHVYLNGIYDGDSSSTSFALSCIAPGVSYTATVKAFDASGNVSTTAATKTFSSLSGGLSGDLDCNGTVNSTDLFTLLRNWQATDALPPSGDVTGDATVNSTDLFDLLRNWGKSA